MSAIETLRREGSIHSAPARTGGSLVRLLNAVAEGASVMMERRRSRFVLLGLTDDQLKDIGLSRADAEREGLRKPWE